MASTVSNGNDRSEKWQRPLTKGKFAAATEGPTLWKESASIKRKSQHPTKSKPALVLATHHSNRVTGNHMFLYGAYMGVSMGCTMLFSQSESPVKFGKW